MFQRVSQSKEKTIKAQETQAMSEILATVYDNTSEKKYILIVWIVKSLAR